MSNAGNTTAEQPGQKKPQIVFDSKKTPYTLRQNIGAGGQGMVLTTDQPNIVVKISDPLNETQLTLRRSQIMNVMRANLRDLKIARPLDMLLLKNRIGYVMELMDGLIPLQTVIENAAVINNDGCVDLAAYRSTGGLKRRILILRELAETLAKLHGRGMAYGDLSPSNVFVSESVEHHQVWLIDADNISIHESYGSSHLHTPNYAAPELVRGESGSNIWTDCWSFAVIALQLLTHTHPFDSGVAVADADPDDALNKANKGLFPWIFDQEDDSNAWTGSGLPLEDLVSHQIMVLFHRCFGSSRAYEGLAERPTMSEWHLVLHRASQMILTCDGADCGMSFFYNKFQKCPFCDQELDANNYLILNHYMYDTMPEQPQKNEWIATSERVVINIGETKSLYHEPYSFLDLDLLQPWCQLTLTNEGLYFQPQAGKYVRLNEVDVLSRGYLLTKEQKRQTGHCVLERSTRDQTHPMYPAWRFNW